MIETTQDALSRHSHGFTYLMDKHDNEWLDKNNKEACGEGTLAQGAIATSGTAMRTSWCSANEQEKYWRGLV